MQHRVEMVKTTFDTIDAEIHKYFHKLNFSSQM